MIWVDYAILAIVAISGVFSLMRGFIREALSLVGWVAAFWIAIAYCVRASALLDGYVEAPFIRLAIAFATLLIAVLLLCGIVLRAVGALVERTGMSGTDRTLGIVFGVVRGVVIAGFLVLLAGLTPLPADPWWRQSIFLPHLVRLANEVRPLLPANVEQRIRFESDV